MSNNYYNKLADDVVSFRWVGWFEMGRYCEPVETLELRARLKGDDFETYCGEVVYPTHGCSQFHVWSGSKTLTTEAGVELGEAKGWLLDFCGISPLYENKLPPLKEESNG